MVRNIKDHTPDQIKFNYTVGRNLNYIRTIIFKMTQQKLAKQLGVTFQQVQKYESSSNAVSGYRLKQLADIFNVNMSDLCDPYYVEKKKAFKQCEDLNDGYVKPKDYQNSLAEQFEEQSRHDDNIDFLKGRL